jgi:hypothetical protein
MKKPSEHPVTKLADAAFAEVTKDVIKRAVDTGTPLILWVNGKVKEVDPLTVQIESKPARRRKPGS